MNPRKMKGKVLYVEDEIDACRTMMDFLNVRGFAVIISFTAEEAYGLLKRWNPDIILIDIKLIGASGIDFMERMHKEGLRTPLIVITAYPRKLSEIEGRGLKIHGYFEKPYSYADLYRTIKDVLEVTKGEKV